MLNTEFLKRSARTLLRSAAFLAVAAPVMLGQDLAPPSARDIWQIARRELEFLNRLQRGSHGFLIDAYAQYLGATSEVLGDSWSVARMSGSPDGFTVTDLPLPLSHRPLLSTIAGKQKGGWFRSKPKSSIPVSEPRLRPEGVAPMIYLDSAGIGADRYVFQYLGTETLGAFRTWTFLLKPRPSAGLGAFSGKIWVVDHDIVRFSGSFIGASPRQKGGYVSFDSVRFKGANGHWLPWKTYLDETASPPSAPGIAMRARIGVWGFDSQAGGILGTVGIKADETVDTTHAAGTQSFSEDVYLEAESNLLRWLVGVGFLAPAGKFERDVCDPIIDDILTANNITLDRPLSCRILLTAPAETVLFESIIAVSRTVFDLAPNTATVAVLIAREVALAKIRSSHLDLAWGRPDILMVRDERELISLLAAAPTQVERDQADDLALEYLTRLKSYKRQDLETAAIFLYTASNACKTKPALLTPRFGDGLPGCGREARISRMALAAPPGSEPNPAMHVGARTKINPWDDSVSRVTAQRENAPFRIIPEPMTPELAPDDPDANDDSLVQPTMLPHKVPSSALRISKRK
jgi:hypothetical protein